MPDHYTNSQGEPAEFACWGWSDESQEAAAKRGSRRAEQVMQRVLRGDTPDRYLCSDRALREELVKDLWRAIRGHHTQRLWLLV